MNIIERAIKQAEQDRDRTGPRLRPIDGDAGERRDRGSATRSMWMRPPVLLTLCGALIGMVCGAALHAVLADRDPRQASAVVPVVRVPDLSQAVATTQQPPSVRQAVEPGAVTTEVQRDTGARPDTGTAAAPDRAPVPPEPAAVRDNAVPSPRRTAAQQPRPKRPDADLQPPAPPADPQDGMRSLSTSALNNAALLYLEQGDTTHARIFLQEALRRAPGNTVALNNAGLLCYREGDYAAAIRYYERALAQQPDNIETLVNKAVAQRALSRWADAHQSLTEALGINPRHPEALYNYALLLEDMRRPDAARWYFEQFISLAPGHLRGLAEQVRRHLSGKN